MATHTFNKCLHHKTKDTALLCISWFLEQNVRVLSIKPENLAMKLQKILMVANGKEDNIIRFAKKY